jgi:hypothetical protein
LFNSDAHIPEADYIDLAVSNEYPYRQNTLMGMFWGLSFTARQRSEALLFVLSEVR